MRAHEIYEDAELRCDTAARRPEEVKVPRVFDVLIEDRFELPLAELGFDREIWEAGDAQVLLGHRDERLDRVCDRSGR